MLTADDLNSSLPTVAASAALELDCVIRGHQSKLANVKILASVLSSVTEAAQARVEAGGLADPSVVLTMGMAIEHAGWNRPATLKDLVLKALDIAGMLSGSHFQPADLPTLKAFCIALSKCAVASVARNLPEQYHPFRS